jgi:hypothetical protein
MFMTEQGRSQMTTELREARDLFKSTFDTFEWTVQPAWDRLGVTEERLQEFGDNYIKTLRDNPGE